MRILTPAAADEAPLYAGAWSARAARPHWRNALPELGAGSIVLRELRVADAVTLHELLNTGDVSRFISPPPTTVGGFERFICWTEVERSAGRSACFAIVAAGMDTAVGIIQVRQTGLSFDTAEWGFALGSAFWGTGLFVEAATIALEFAFETLGVHRLEARASRLNGRGNGALRKLGALHEGVLRSSFLRNGESHDQILWAILQSDWRQQRTHAGSPRPDLFRVISTRRSAST